MTAIVDFPDALSPVIQTVTPFCPSSFSRSSRVTEPSCQVTLVAFCSAMVPSKRSGEIRVFAGTLRHRRAPVSLFFFEQRSAEIAFPEAGEHDDDHLALVFRSRGDFGGGGDVTAAADAGEEAFF